MDDELGGRKTLEGILRPFGYDLVFATSGAEALTQAAANAPDLMVLDVMMPGMDGFEVCRRLRADPRLAEIPVIMLTALDDRESRLQGIAAGADDFISKPFDRQGTACGRASRPRLCRPGCWARWCRGTRPCAMPTRCTLMVSRPPY